MKNLQKHLRAAIVQAAPVLFDKKATLEKVVRQIQEAAANGAELIVFPESLVPCYPYGLTFGFTVGSRKEEGRKDWKVYYDNAVLVPDDTVSLAAAAKKARAWVSIGVTERDPVNCSLYCTNLVFSPEGKLASVHREIKPTGSERYIWADSHVPETYFPVVDTPWGRMGSLICWENYMPLARVALYQKGISLYLAPNTNDNPEWQDTIRHIAIESHCYVFNVDHYFTRDMYPADLLEQEEIGRLNDIVCRGGSCIIDPYGHCVTEPVWDKEAIVYADLDMDKVPMSRMEFDATGHYTRPDILELKVHDEEGR